MNNQGKTCLDLAKDRNKTEVVKILERLDQIHQNRLDTAAEASSAASTQGIYNNLNAGKVSLFL